MLTIYHNPRCSKSREALSIVEDYARSRSLPLNVVDYQKSPLSAAELRKVQAKLALPLDEMMRPGEEEYGALGLANASDERLLEALVAQPKLLQRPIVELGDRAVIARPPELLRTFLP